MRILLTNNTLDMRAGSELYIRDIALALLAKGHQPIAYSRHLGDVARELRDASVLVIDDLSQLSQPPDIIHAQHHLEAMTALTQFPNIPAIYVCHGWLPPQEAPPKHPRIYRYLAVDKLVELRLTDECGLPKEVVHVCLNFVDLQRFTQRSPLPKRAVRALAFSNYINESNVLPALRDACKQSGLQLDVLGASSGNAHARPEELLSQYDIVFAKARAALEAAAVGAAVIVCDSAGIGEMTSLEKLGHFRDYNFGLRLLRNKVTVAAVKEQLDRYNAADANEVTEQIRAEIDINLAVDKLIGHYHAAIDAHRCVVHTETSESQAVSAYLRHGPVHSDFSQSESVELNKQIIQVDTQTRLLESQSRRLQQQLSDSESRLRGVQLQNRHLQKEVLVLKSKLADRTGTSSTKEIKSPSS